MAARRFSFLTLLGALGIGVGLWVYVSLMRSYEDDLVVPFVVLSPPNQALLSTVPPTLTLRVRASGLQLLNLKYFTESAACTLDLKKLRPTGPSTYTAESPDLLRGIVSAIPIRTISVAPSELALATGDLTVKRVPLLIQHNIACRVGFVLGAQPHSVLQEVEVRGTKSIVDRIQHWSTQRLSLDDLHESAVVDIPVNDSMMSLISVVPRLIPVTVNVQQSAELTIMDVPVVLTTSHGTVALEVRPSRVRIVVRGGVDDVSAVTARDVHAEISERPANGYTVPRVVAPSSVRVISIDPPFVRVIARREN
ncbi:MAG: hypothetical protein NTX15_06590 [Candidatus Kapabacteria bacterium]|nr:hypothetical protein [Candidatus Kapabacteria bacterium]